MKRLISFRSTNIRYVFTDIDGTLTGEGRLPVSSYGALWDLHEAGIEVVPVTGRPAGWCEMIARLWPVVGVIGENGALMFSYQGSKMLRHYAVGQAVMRRHRQKLDAIKKEILQAVPGTAVASDQSARMFDLAIDYTEDVNPLPVSDAHKIVQIFEAHGATAKISSIHVNGWFGSFDKLSMCRWFCTNVLQIDFDRNQAKLAFIGDSHNDEPMFAAFDNSFAVANIKPFVKSLKSLPHFVTSASESEGFAEFARHLIRLQRQKA